MRWIGRGKTGVQTRRQVGVAPDLRGHDREGLDAEEGPGQPLEVDERQEDHGRGQRARHDRQPTSAGFSELEICFLSKV